MEVDEEVVLNHVPGQQIQLSNDQVRNNAGGFGFQVTDLERLKRFLVLGTEGGTYYAGEKELGLENVKCIRSLIEAGRGKEVVDVVKQYSVEGRCAKQTTIVYTLALCARFHDGSHGSLYTATRKAAYEALSAICRIPTDLFHFVKFCEDVSKAVDKKTGWGRAHRKAIAKWYMEKRGERLAYLVTKYKQRDGWSHKDLLRLSHPKPTDEKKGHSAVFKYILRGYPDVERFVKKVAENGFPVDKDLSETMGMLKATNDAMQAENEEQILELIKEHNLVREHLPTKFLTSKKVWFQLLQGMPITALLRNLGNMSSKGMFEDSEGHQGKEIALTVANWLTDETRLQKARVHPFNILVALRIYKSGKGDKGSKTWLVNDAIVNALDEAFYKAFKFVVPTNKRYLLGIDVSGSMTYGGCHGTTVITPAEASAAMAMLALKTEPSTTPMAFASSFVPLKINKDMKLDDVLRETRKMMFGATDCAQPMLYALEKKLEVDVFIVYTDCETWIGNVHPHQALQNYRADMNIPDAKLIVCAMTSGGFTIADPNDRFMLDVVGFDAGAPQVMAQFAKGEM
eukprot:Seg593.1 transcript_id=Seg593.1/GoldUCD/mRNA.D3Y31 product="60 kDa SS-A/Ro ribonucleoprotein" protein_id=Seg593.1/GoldUCD/D3Y31